MMKKITKTSSLSWGSSEEVACVRLHVFVTSPKRTVSAPCEYRQMPTDIMGEMGKWKD
jgi:hypothetical protein